jgi:hypothetical protein
MPTLALLIVICAGVFYGARMMLPVQPGESEFGDEY